MNPEPSMLASFTSGSAPSSATSNSASERGLVPAGLASTIAALVATSPCAGSRGGSTLMARRSSPSGRPPLATRQSSAAAIWSEKRLNRVTYLAYLGSKASTRALSQLGQREKPCTAFAPQGRTIWRAPARRRLATRSEGVCEAIVSGQEKHKEVEESAGERRTGPGG